MLVSYFLWPLLYRQTLSERNYNSSETTLLTEDITLQAGKSGSSTWSVQRNVMVRCGIIIIEFPVNFFTLITLLGYFKCRVDYLVIDFSTNVYANSDTRYQDSSSNLTKSNNRNIHT